MFNHRKERRNFKPGKAKDMTMNKSNKMKALVVSAAMTALLGGGVTAVLLPGIASGAVAKGTGIDAPGHIKHTGIDPVGVAQKKHGVLVVRPVGRAKNTGVDAAGHIKHTGIDPVGHAKHLGVDLVPHINAVGHAKHLGVDLVPHIHPVGHAQKKHGVLVVRPVGRA
jgi:hypothetical protein